MLSKLPSVRASMRGRFRVIRVLGVAGVVMFVQLPGSIRPFKFMAFTGNTRKRNRDDQQGKKFHLRAS